jgi:hypothetical protein
MSVQLSEEMRRRMMNWARWVRSGRRTLYDGRSVITKLYVMAGDGPRGEHTESLLAGEAEDTDHAVRALPADNERALRIWWLGRGSMRQRARQCRCREAAFYQRVNHAHALVAAWLTERARRREQHYQATRALRAGHLPSSTR